RDALAADFHHVVDTTAVQEAAAGAYLDRVGRLAEARAADEGGAHAQEAVPLRDLDPRQRRVGRLWVDPGRDAARLGRAEDLLGRDVEGRQRRLGVLPIEGSARRDHVAQVPTQRSEEHTSELQSREKIVCRLLLEIKTRNEARC